MSAHIEWRDEWLLGIPLVDREHQELARLFNQVEQRYSCLEDEPASDKGDRAKEIVGLLQMLGEHVRSHFHNEEALMRDAGYPDFQDHYTEHVTLLAEYAELLRDLDKQGVECLEEQTLNSLKTWLIGHVANADMRFGEFYRKQASASPRGRK